MSLSMPNSWWRVRSSKQLSQTKLVGRCLEVLLPLWLISAGLVTASTGLAIGQRGPGVTVPEVPGA
jgi:hypothetical protein